MQVDDVSEVSSAYDIASSPNGRLREEQSLGLLELVNGQNHSERLSPSALMGDGGGLIMLRISKKGVCRQVNNLCLEDIKNSQVNDFYIWGGLSHIPVQEMNFLVDWLVKVQLTLLVWCVVMET